MLVVWEGGEPQFIELNPSLLISKSGPPIFTYIMAIPLPSDFTPFVLGFNSALSTVRAVKLTYAGSLVFTYLLWHLSL